MRIYKTIGICFGLVCLSSLSNANLHAQKPDFYKVGAYSYKDSKFSPNILDGTWIRNNVFFCGYRNGEEYGINRKQPWIGVFDQASGKLVKEESWESTGSFTKIISNASTGLVTVITECYGQLFVAQFDSSLTIKQSFYTKDFYDVSYVGTVGNKGGFLSIMHEGNHLSELTDFTSMYRFKVMYFDQSLKKTFESGYIDSTRVVLALSDSYGSVIGVSKKLTNEDFKSYQMEILTLNQNNSIHRSTIPWILPIRKVSDKTCKLNVYKVHNIVNPGSQGVGIVADIAYKDMEYPYYDIEKKYTAYMYMSSDGKINESSIVKLVDPNEFDFASTNTLVYEDKVIVYSYANDDGNNGNMVIPGLSNIQNNSHLSIFDVTTQKITFSSPLVKTYPFLKDCFGDNMGNIDEYNVSAIFSDTDNYGYFSVVYYMLNIN